MVNRPIFKTYGGKWRIAPWIIGYMPNHWGYIEPMCRAASVFLQKPRVRMETIGDIDGNVTNFITQVRDNVDALVRAIELTPWSREEFRRSFEPSDDPLELARRFWLQSTMSIANMPGDSGMKMVYNKENAPGRLQCLVEYDQSHLHQAARRLIGVQIENKDYRDIIERYDHPENLFYLDPPYVKSTRTQKNQYIYEWGEQDHIELAHTLKGRKGYFVISGYQNELYETLFEEAGWHREEREFIGNSGTRQVECIWLCPRIVRFRTLQPVQIPLLL